MAAPHLPTLLLAICAVLGGCAEDEPVERKDDGDVICVGATPPASAWSASPGPLVDDAGAGGSASSVIPGPNTQPGAPAPVYTLEDFQPESCGYQAAYGLEPMIGRVTLVFLWSAWCTYCQGQAVEMEGFRDELVEQGLDVHIVAINSIDGLAEQQELTSRCSFPLLQDHADVRVWEDHHQADKDDMLIYDAAGVLYDYFPAGGDRTTNLKESQGRQNLIEAIVGAGG